MKRGARALSQLLDFILEEQFPALQFDNPKVVG